MVYSRGKEIIAFKIETEFLVSSSTNGNRSVKNFQKKWKEQNQNKLDLMIHYGVTV